MGQSSYRPLGGYLDVRQRRFRMEEKNQNVSLTITVALITALSGFGGAFVGGYYVLRANEAQIKSQEVKYKIELTEKYLDKLIVLASEYNKLTDELVNLALTNPSDERALLVKMSQVQLKGTEIMIITNDDIASYVNSVNSYSTQFIQNRLKDNSQEYLNKLGIIKVDLFKKIRNFILNSKNINISLPNQALRSDSLPLADER